MRWVIGLAGVVALCVPCRAQSFPTSLVTNDKALVCKAPERLPDAALAYEKKDPRALRRTGCRLLKGGMLVSVEFAQRFKTENYHLIRITWRRGPSLWGYSYDFKKP
jgi:hypothetical protein